MSSKQTIPQERAILYFLLFGALPLALVFINFNARKSEIELINSRLDNTLALVEKQNQSERSNRQVRKKYLDKDPRYVEKHIETIKPLTSEMAILEKVTGTGFFPDEQQATKRANFLKGAENKLSFTESPQKNYPKCIETEFSLSKSVEVDMQDLRKILSRIEGVSLGGEPLIETRPHLLITDFKIERKKALVCEVYALNLKILQRQYEK